MKFISPSSNVHETVVDNEEAPAPRRSRRGVSFPVFEELDQSGPNPRRSRNSELETGSQEPEILNASILDRVDDSLEFLNAQRNGIFVVSGFLVFVFISALIVRELEHWPYLDSFRFIIVTLTSTGYGDRYPDSTGGKLFICFFVLSGAVMLSIVVGTIAGSVSIVPEKEHSSFFGFRVSRIAEVLLSNLLTMGTLISIGVLFYSSQHQLTPFNAFYFSIITLGSVGYGESDIMNQISYTEPAQVFSIFYIFIGVISFASCFTQLASVIAEINISRQIARLTKMGATEALIKKLDQNGDESVDKAEYLQVMLVEWGRCQKRDIDQALALFDQLDPDKSGTIDLKDIRRAAHEQERARRIQRERRRSQPLGALIHQFLAEQAEEEAAAAATTTTAATAAAAAPDNHARLTNVPQHRPSATVSTHRMRLELPDSLNRESTTDDFPSDHPTSSGVTYSHKRYSDVLADV